MAVTDLDPGKMRLPDDFGVPYFHEFPGQIGKRPVPAPGVDPHHTDAFLRQKKGAFPVHAGALDQVLRLSPERIGARLHEDNVHGFDLIADPVELFSDILSGDPFAVALMAEIQEDAVAKAPFQGDFIDGRCRLPPVHHGMIMIGRVQVCAAVRRQRQELHGPADAAGKLLFLQARKELQHGGGSHGVVDVIDAGNHHGGITGKPRFNRNAQINKTSALHRNSFLIIL